MPFTCVIRYQPEPELLVTQVVLHALPVTWALTVTGVPAARLTLMVAVVDVLVRRFTPSHFASMVVLGAGVAVATAVGVAVAVAVAEGVGVGEGVAEAVGDAVGAAKVVLPPLLKRQAT